MVPLHGFKAACTFCIGAHFSIDNTLAVVYTESQLTLQFLCTEPGDITLKSTKATLELKPPSKYIVKVNCF